MPFAQVHITEGHSADQKRVLIREITQAVHDSVGAPMPNSNAGGVVRRTGAAFGRLA